MSNVEYYLDSIKDKVKKERSKKESKVEKRIVELVEECMTNNEVSSIKEITNKLNKTKNYSSYVRLVVQKSDNLEFVKVKGINIIVTK